MHWMDLLRGLAVVLVVAFHAGTMPGVPEPVNAVNDALGSYRLAALFLASGLLLDRSLAKGPTRYVTGKLRHIVWPYLVWTTLMLPLLGAERGLDPAWWVYPRGSHTWFLSTLAVIYAVGFLTRVLAPGWIMLGLLVASQLIDRGAFALAPFFHEVSWWGVFFFLGVMLSRHVDAVVGAPVWAFGIGACVTVGWSIINALPDPPAAKTVLAAVMSTIGVGTIVWLLARMPRVWPVTLLQRLGRRSIVTYLVHLPVLKIAVFHLAWPGGWAGYLSLVLVTLLVCTAATRHYGRLRWLFEWPEGQRRPPITTSHEARSAAGRR